MLVYRQAKATQNGAIRDRPCQKGDVTKRALVDFDLAPHLVKATWIVQGEKLCRS